MFTAHYPPPFTANRLITIRYGLTSVDESIEDFEHLSGPIADLYRLAVPMVVAVGKLDRNADGSAASAEEIIEKVEEFRPFSAAALKPVRLAVQQCIIPQRVLTYLLSHHALEPLAEVPKEREGDFLLVYASEHVDHGGEYYLL